MVVAFDTLQEIHPTGTDPRRLDEQMRPLGLGPGLEHDVHSVLALVENAFGIRLTREDLNDEPHLSGLLCPLAD